MRKSLPQNSHFELVLLFPPALGDSMMTSQALRIYSKFLPKFSTLGVISREFHSVFKILFPDWTFIAYDSKLNGLNLEMKCNHLIDFRSDNFSIKYRAIPCTKNLFWFDFEGDRRVAYRQSDANIKYLPTIKIKDHFSEIGNEVSAWKMDAELISSFISIGLQSGKNNREELQYFDNERLVSNYFASKNSRPIEIIIFPCGTNPQKHWQIDRWISLIDHLINLNLEVKIFLGPKEKSIRHFFNCNASIFIDSDWQFIIDHLHENSIVICNDCGPMHVCGILRAPLVAIFGPTNERVWFTYERNAFSVRSQKSLWPEVNEVFCAVLSVKDQLMSNQ